MRLEISQEVHQESWSQSKSRWVCWSQLVAAKGEKLASHKYKELSAMDQAEASQFMKPNMEVPQDGEDFHPWEKMQFLIKDEESATRNTTKEGKQLENKSDKLVGELWDAELEGFEKASEGLGSFNRPAKKAKAKKKEEPVKTEDRPLSLLFNTFRLPFSFKAQF